MCSWPQEHRDTCTSTTDTQNAWTQTQSTRLQVTKIIWTLTFAFAHFENFANFAMLEKRLMFKSPYYFNPYLQKMSHLHFWASLSCIHLFVHSFSCNYGVIHSLSLLTSWPGRSIPLHISWRTRPRSPAPSPHSTLSRRHRLWHRGSSPRRCSAFLWCSGRCATKKNGSRTQTLPEDFQWRDALYTALVLHPNQVWAMSQQAYNCYLKLKKTFLFI